ARILTAPVGERKAIAQAAYEQVVHAAGVTRSKGGRAWYEEQKKQRVAVDNSAYDSSGGGRDLIVGTDGEATRRSAIHDSQTNKTFLLPNYREFQRASAKVGLYEHIIASPLNFKLVNFVQHIARSLWLFQPSTAQRAAIDHSLSAWSQGVGFGEQAKSRIALSSQGAKNIYNAAKAKAATEVDDTERHMLRDLPGVWAAALISDIRRLKAAPIDQFDDRFQQRMREVAQDRLDGELLDLHAGTQAAGTLQSADEARRFAQEGYKVFEEKLKTAGYELAGIDDGAGGAKLWAKEINKRLSTEQGRKAFKAATLKDPPSILDDDAWPVEKPPKTMRRRKSADRDEHQARIASELAAEDRTPQLHPREELVNFMLSPDFIEGRALLDRFSTLRDGTKVDSADEAMVRRAAEELADDQIADWKALVSGQDGKLNEGLVAAIQKDGKATVGVLSKIEEGDRPKAVIQPKYAPDLSEGNSASNIMSAIVDAGYHRIVGAPIDWLSTTPIYGVNYARAYDRVENWYKTVDAGYRELTVPPKEVVRQAKAHPERKILEQWHDLQKPFLEPYLDRIREVARMQAKQATAKMVDNPRVQSQLALTTKNLFNFYRAQEDFIRRWARNMKESPENLRKMQLAVEGGMHMGLVYPDQNGELVFAYPGSGAAINMVAKALSHFGMGSVVNLPIMPNLSTKITFISPGLDRPFLPTTSPVASIPLRVLRHFYGDQLPLMQGQAIAEGQIATDRTWWQNFLPSLLFRPLTAMSADELEGQLASATRNGLVNTHGAQPLPDNASPDDRQKFKDQVRVAVRNHMVFRALAGFFLPAAPSTPSEDTATSRTNPIEQGTFHSISLRQEWTAMVNKYGYQKAFQVWSESRPDELIYTVGTTEGSLGVGGQLAPTDTVLQWMQDNPGLVKNFGS
ncbi:MAG TPA: hypothetical protein VF506_07955, partial [Streptosporangiaceae bacterium]